MLVKPIIASALLGIVAAVNDAPNVPVSAQIGALDFGLTCNVAILGNYTFDAFFSATANAQGNSGQQIYYEDVVIKFTIPPSITRVAGLVGAKSASANVSLALNLDNATPSVLNVFPNGLQVNNVSFTAGQPTTVRVPPTGTLAAIGPVTLGDAGTTHTIHLGDISIAVSLPVLGIIPIPISIKCPAKSQPILYDVGIVNVLPSGTDDFPSKPTTGGDNQFAPIDNDEQTGSFRFPYTCDFDELGQQDVDLTVTGTVPGSFTPGEQFTVDDAYAFLRIPSALATAVQGIVPQAAAARMTVKEFIIGLVNGSPESINALPSPQVSTFDLVSDQDIGIAVPGNTTLTIGPLTAGVAGEELFLESGETTGSVDVLDKEGSSLKTLGFVCGPKYTSRLIGIAVTTVKPPPITA